MLKYTIEENINFNDELYKLLDLDSDDEDNLCQITGGQLTDKHVILECNHHFNYDAIYKEIYNQKYKFKTYDIATLTQKNKLKFLDSGLDYYIKCPYCRNIQFTILPYYEELGLKQIYGINSLDKTLPNSIVISGSSTPFDNYKNTNINNYTYNLYGQIFKKGNCCEKINSFGDECTHCYVTQIPETQLYYCKNHYRVAIKSLKMSKKKQIMDAKLLNKKEREDKLLEKKKLLEEQNTERVKNGLLPLKQIKPKVENIVEHQPHVIEQYISEEGLEGCNAILKTGTNKGKLCGCKKIETNGLCKRHSPKINNK
jgi:hypothetical protein